MSVNPERPQGPDQEPVSRDRLSELTPFVRRAVSLDPAALVRIRSRSASIAAFIRLPFGVLAARTVPVPTVAPIPATAAAPPRPDSDDVVVLAQELLDWLDEIRPSPPERADAAWRAGVPPEAGWQRVEAVPDRVVRDLVRAGAMTLKQAAHREGVPEAQPRAEVADALLDSVVLTVTDEHRTVPVTLRQLSALTRMGFVARDSQVAIDQSGRWLRVAAAYGSVYAERPGVGLGIVTRNAAKT